MEEEILLYGLAYDCPYQQRDENCPFFEVDHLSFVEKVKWLDGLNHSIKEEIIKRHLNCSKNRV